MKTIFGSGYMGFKICEHDREFSYIIKIRHKHETLAYRT